MGPPGNGLVFHLAATPLTALHHHANNILKEATILVFPSLHELFSLCRTCRELQAFIAEYPVLQYYVSQHKKCLLGTIKTTNGQSSWNVAFKKNSPWKNIVSKKILEYKEKGLFDNIMTKWIQTRCISESAVHLTSQKYTIGHFSGLMILLCCFSILSVILLLFECLISKRMKSSSDYSLKST